MSYFNRGVMVTRDFIQIRIGCYRITFGRVLREGGIELLEKELSKASQGATEK